MLSVLDGTTLLRELCNSQIHDDAIRLAATTGKVGYLSERAYNVTVSMQNTFDVDGEGSGMYGL